MKNLIFNQSWALKWGLNLWPPFLLTGIHVVELAADYRYAKVELRMRPWNKNAVGSHFGGSIFAMTDPMYMLMLLSILHPHYYVWDKLADIDFIKPGIGRLTAEFTISDGLLDEIRKATANGEKYLPNMVVTVKDQQGDVVARLKRTLYIRKKKRKLASGDVD